MVDEIILTQPDDWHVHLRDGAQLATTVPSSARSFGRAIVMPNLNPPVTTTPSALAYRTRILQHVPPSRVFEPLMTLYLTETTTGHEIERAAAGAISGVKLYPATATTHSEAGVSDWRCCDEALACMQEQGLPLLIHGEAITPGIDIFDREAVFLERELEPLLQRYPRLKIVLEHITTAAAVEFVRQAPPRLAATITAHHLLLNRNDLLLGGLRPHYYCLPVLKRERDREALLEAASSGSPKFFLGTDSAPHARSAKENASGCAGIFTAPAALELYTEAFEQAGCLSRLEGFASHFGADFYGLPRNPNTIRLRRESWSLPATYPYGQDVVIPLRATSALRWRLIC
ncbi:dihydroorotase [Nitrococcus mobilis]|uniref:Dihydroorotase n=1 Tax=Nitrococcus mobilis Nb-231 TaxID=314278 RepID=A4BPF3_9GAMM|nr:dihydroorotase [Nitrococcus mobilis]EAR22454.1 dihydroorotase [Nitrococcus mobilis Nb-231]